MAITSGALIGAAAIGAGGGILSSILGKPKSSKPKFSSTNPASGVIAGLLGGTPVRTVGGGFSFGGPAGHVAAPNILTPFNKRRLFEFISNPVEFTDVERAGQEALSDIQTAGLGNLDTLLSDFITPAAQEALSTGFLVDDQPFIDNALNRLQRETLPNLVEQFAGTSGVQSSDFGRELVRSARDVETSIALNAMNLADAAANRRLSALGAAPAAVAGGSAAQAGLIDAIATLEANLRKQEEAARPGARILSTIIDLAGLGSPSNLGTVGSLEQRGNTLGDLGQIIGPLSQLAGSFLSRTPTSTPSTGSPGVPVAPLPNTLEV